MPVTHGMTVGEIARLFNTEIGCDLEVVSMLGWRRDLFFDETGLPWVNPSPNMRSLTEELLYPMIALLEANPAISVGRGTDRPFEHVGAPWMDAEALVGNLRARGLGGVWPMRTTFVPAADSSYPHHGETCQGVRFVVTDRRALRPVEAGIHLIAALLDVHGEHFDTRRLRGLVGAQWVLDALNAGEEPSAIAGRWRDSKRFSSFSEARARALLY